MKAAVLARRAQADLLEAVAWIARDNPMAARGLRNAVVKAATLIGRHPQGGVVRLDLADERIRFLVMRGYPYVLVYAADTVPPRVLRVLHGARDLPDLLGDLHG